MKVLDIFTDTLALAVTPLGDRLYALAHDVAVSIVTDDGTLKYHFRKGFVTNFRSGGVLVDGIIDQIGNGKQQLAYLTHDAAYTPCAAFAMEHPISKPFADEILRQVLILGGVSPFKARLVKWSVTAFGASAYWDDDELTESNSKLFTFEWFAKYEKCKTYDDIVRREG